MMLLIESLFSDVIRVSDSVVSIEFCGSNWRSLDIARSLLSIVICVKSRVTSFKLSDDKSRHRSIIASRTDSGCS